MYVTDIKKEFFDQLLKEKRVLIFANLDVDSIAAVKILTTLFQFDQVHIIKDRHFQSNILLLCMYDAFIFNNN